MHSILDQEMPGLSARVEGLPTHARQRVVLMACRTVAAKADFLDEDLRATVDQLSSDALLSASELARIRQRAESADAKYFELQESDEQASLRSFSAARFLTAIAAGFERATTEGACEALYELSKAVDDPSDLVRSIETEIGAQ